MNVLVTDGDNRAALAITRSLGRKGHRIVVGEKSLPSLASVSRYCSEGWTYPDPLKRPDDFLDDLFRTVREKRIDVLLPVTEITTGLATENAGRLAGACRLPFPDADAFRTASNKLEILRLAERLGVPVPATRVLHEKGNDPGSIAGLSYPIVIKPHRSRVRTEDGWRSAGVSYARTPEELSDLLGKKGTWEYPVLLQERIPGPGVGVFACYRYGEMVSLFGHRRIREKPPSGGVSVLRESVPVSSRARASTAKLLDHLKWHGVAMVEFKEDERDGVPKLMEINGRFWGSLQLAIDAGVDFPEILLRIANGETVEPDFSYKAGVETRWLWGDVDSLLMLLLKRRRNLDLPEGHPGRIRAVFDFLRFYGKDLHYEVESLGDLRPFLHETSRRFRRTP
ncbi:MAG: carboxylate--amine ligase [Deltaproteobacteria bacterium]|nr:MAG: carboxylate--amine ligase [Deltaproteobacteria bacterium]